MKLSFYGLIFSSLFAVNTALADECTQIAGMKLPADINAKLQLKSTAQVLGKNIDPRIDILKGVFAKLTNVSGFTPALLVCSDNIVNASAAGTPDISLVKVYLPILDLARGEPDQIAALIGHELAHIQLNHSAKHYVANQVVAGQAVKVGVDYYKKTGMSTEAEQKAKDFFELVSTRVSRDLERQADEKGFSIAYTLGGYNPDAAKRFYLKSSELPPAQVPYLSDHPGWSERYNKASLLSDNQKYINKARILVADKKWNDLAALTDAWLKVVPESGAGWYYKGRALSHKIKNKTKISRTFEDSLSFFLHNTSLGSLSQEDQDEVDDAWLNLCVALYDEGYDFESANCYRRIKSQIRKEAYLKRTSQKVLIVGNNEPILKTNLWIGRDDNGTKLFTNDQATASNHPESLEVPPVWKPVRTPAVK